MIKLQGVKAPLDFTGDFLKQAAAKGLSVPPRAISSVQVLKKSLDARRKTDIHYVLSLGVDIPDASSVFARCKNKNASLLVEPPLELLPPWPYKLSPVIVGTGPAGLLAALTLARAGAKPVVLERGAPVCARQKDVEGFWAGGELDPDSNVQFGEGGAGTFSDGKLTCGIKDPRVQQVLKTFHQAGAPEDILIDAKPHVGTDLLRTVVKNIREEIIALGGRVEFHAKFCDFKMQGGQVGAVCYEQNGITVELPTEQLILATGHSARDVFSLLHQKEVTLIQKAFSIGLRIEHRQGAIDQAMYGAMANAPHLPPADYKLATRLASGRSVYSFCMCPGGFVVASSSEAGAICTNGMSYHKRDAPNANAALLVGVEPSDFGSDHPLAGIALQREIEQRAYQLSNTYRAPACTVGDMHTGRATGKFSTTQPSYMPGTVPALPGQYLPGFIAQSLEESLGVFSKKIHGFDAMDAVLTGPEARSSSPVRILRGANGASTSHPGLYPIGEGAGYAGGIVSAGVDGIKIAEKLLGRVL